MSETEERKRVTKVKIPIPPEPTRKIEPREEKEGKKPIAEKGKKEREI